MTFGECLGSLMKSRNISVSRLTELMFMKSRNSIQRILKDESSINIIEAFKNKLIELDPLNLSASELEQLEQSIEVSKVGKDTVAARKILLQIFDNSYYRVKSHCPAVLNPLEEKSISLRELFASYKAFDKIKLLIFDVVSAEFINELVNVIRTSPPALISIAQILYFGTSRSHNAATLVSVFKLFNYEHYEVYCISNELTSNIHPYISPNTIVIDKETAKGSHYTDLIMMDTDLTFSYVKDVQGNSLFSFYLYHFNKLRQHCQNIRTLYKNENPVETVLSISDKCGPIARNSNCYLIEHSFTYSMIPFDILVKMLIEADYCGMDDNNPVIQKLLQVFNERFYHYNHPTKMKISFLTKRGILDFVKNRVMGDHFIYFRPFTKQEVKIILEFILKQLEENDLFKIYLLKNDYSVGNIQFSYFENNTLWLFDSCSGYGEDYFEGIIDSIPILEVYDDFIKNELLKNHTLPESETIDFLKYLISME